MYIIGENIHIIADKVKEALKFKGSRILHGTGFEAG